MKLAELDPKFLKLETAESWRFVPTIAQADGVEFLCPKCFKTNNGPVGTHAVICWQPHIGKTIEPGPGRWKLVGTSMDDLSLVASSSSVLLNSGCRAHFFIENGMVRMA